MGRCLSDERIEELHHVREKHPAERWGQYFMNVMDGEEHLLFNMTRLWECDDYQKSIDIMSNLRTKDRLSEDMDVARDPEAA